VCVRPNQSRALSFSVSVYVHFAVRGGGIPTSRRVQRLTVPRATCDRCFAGALPADPPPFATARKLVRMASWTGAAGPGRVVECATGAGAGGATVRRGEAGCGAGAGCGGGLEGLRGVRAGESGAPPAPSPLLDDTFDDIFTTLAGPGRGSDPARAGFGDCGCRGVLFPMSTGIGGICWPQ